MLDNIQNSSNDVSQGLSRVHEAVKKRKKLGEETRYLIFSLIAASEPAGMTTKELVESTGRDRRTVHGICRGYQKRGLIQSKTGKYGKYRLTSKANQVDEPEIGSLLVYLHMMRTGFFGLGEVALTSSMDFCDTAHLQSILEEYQKNPDIIQDKDALGKFFLFEFALRLGASILYIMIQSMKYVNPSLSISESMRDHLISKRFEALANPFFLKCMFELLLHFLELRLWKEYDTPTTPTPPPPPPSEDENEHNVNDRLLKEGDDEMKSFRKKLMKERFEEMERIYKKAFPIIFESLQNLGYDMVYEPGLVELERMEKEDPNHIKCGGELGGTRLDPQGKAAKKCLKCKRWIPVMNKIR
jgi:hypothetical protein